MGQPSTGACREGIAFCSGCLSPQYPHELRKMYINCKGSPVSSDDLDSIQQPTVYFQHNPFAFAYLSVPYPAL